VLEEGEEQGKGDRLERYYSQLPMPDQQQQRHRQETSQQGEEEVARAMDFGFIAFS